MSFYDLLDPGVREECKRLGPPPAEAASLSIAVSLAAIRNDLNLLQGGVSMLAGTVGYSGYGSEIRVKQSPQ